MTPRVVLDTNCIISTLLFSQQKMAWLRHAWQNEQIIPLASKDTVNELMRVLAYPKFKLGKDEQALLLADFLPYAATVVIDKIPEGLPLIRDKDDQMFLILAVAGKADALVSGDADILQLKDGFLTPPIMTLVELKKGLTL